MYFFLFQNQFFLFFFYFFQNNLVIDNLKDQEITIIIKKILNT
jgi:hypothetical protein